MTFWKWSRTADTNSNADSTINFAEGQAPSTLNDSGRAVMAAAAKYRDDIAGAIVTGGTSTAYTVTSFEVFDSLAHLSGNIIAFTPHATNGATVTLNVDGLGAKPLRAAPSVELQSNVLILGTPYVALYNTTDSVFYLHGMGGNTYGIPLAAGMDYWGTTAPSSAFAFPAGQAISRTTYATLFAIMSTTYGVGDGSTTFNLPDKTGRVSAMKEASSTRLTTAGGGVDGATMGSANGLDKVTLAKTQIPTGLFTFNDAQHNHAYVTPTSLIDIALGTGTVRSNMGQFNGGASNNGTTTSTATGASITDGAGGLSHSNTQPTIVCNYIIRVL